MELLTTRFLFILFQVEEEACQVTGDHVPQYDPNPWLFQQLLTSHLAENLKAFGECHYRKQEFQQGFQEVPGDPIKGQ